MAASLRLPNLPREEKLSYIETQKRKLVEYIKFLDDAAVQQHNEDLRSPSTSLQQTATFPPDTRRWSAGSMPGAPTGLSPQFTPDDGFEAVNTEDLPSGSVLATGVKETDEVAQRGWFTGWGTGNRSVSAPQTSQ
jgi:hypothetical protein